MMLEPHLAVDHEGLLANIGLAYATAPPTSEYPMGLNKLQEIILNYHYDVRDHEHLVSEEDIEMIRTWKVNFEADLTDSELLVLPGTSVFSAATRMAAVSAKRLELNTVRVARAIPLFSATHQFLLVIGRHHDQKYGQKERFFSRLSSPPVA